MRGALVRDARKWSLYLGEAISLFGKDVDVLYAGYHWQTWEKGQVNKLIAEQRDLYAFLHDQTVRMMNAGLTGTEIAERLELPPTLKRAWHAQGYYGSVSHNVKASYQRYMGWFDGSPAHLWEYPPKEAAERYIACAASTKFSARLRNTPKNRTSASLQLCLAMLSLRSLHMALLGPSHGAARIALAAVHEQLGFGSENATWRNFVLTGAQDMRAGPRKSTSESARVGRLNPSLSIDHLLDSLSVQLDGQRAAEHAFCIDVVIREEERRWRINLANGALTYRGTSRTADPGEQAGLSFSVSNRQEFIDVISVKRDIKTVKRVGDDALLATLLSLLGAEEPGYRTSRI